MEAPIVLQFGSRMGSYFALMLFCFVFVVLSVAIAGGVARAARLRRRTGWLLGSVVFGVLTATLCYSSLSGFYEAELLGDRGHYSERNAVTGLMRVERRAGR